MPHTIECCPRRVLLVDDNVDLAQSLADVLSMCGHCVETASDGAEGLTKARTFRPDVIVCDLGMPRVDGYEVARQVRRDPQLARIRLIALSAYDRADDALAAGFEYFVKKPPDLRELAVLLRA